MVIWMAALQSEYHITAWSIESRNHPEIWEKIIFISLYVIMISGASFKVQFFQIY